VRLKHSINRKATRAHKQAHQLSEVEVKKKLLTRGSGAGAAHRIPALALRNHSAVGHFEAIPAVLCHGLNLGRLKIEATLGRCFPQITHRRNLAANSIFFWREKPEHVTFGSKPGRTECFQWSKPPGCWRCFAWPAANPPGTTSL